MKNIYVFFFATQYKTGKAIRLMTRNRYSHVALSFDPDTQALYSYARYRYHEPLISGFGIEYTDRYAAFGQTVDIKVCEVPVYDELYARILQKIEFYKENQSSTRYNFVDVLTYPFSRHVELEYTHTCISFLAELLEMQDIHTIPQLEKKFAAQVVYEGPLHEFESCPSQNPIDFFEKRRRSVVYAQSAHVFLILTVSLIKKMIA
ncbi:MAG: hypothetical protein EOM54_05925 [Clostridia bacterium]|nr:hypothetical protein [Clostridia bacterium]NCC68481.1 hypothetical protein [Clostridia bacterium]